MANMPIAFQLYSIPESCARYLLASISLFAQASCISLEIAQMLILLKKRV
jgi:hypothetical protein